MNRSPWFLPYNGAANQLSKSTPEITWLGSSHAGEDLGVPADFRPRRLHRSTRNRSPETKHHQLEEAEEGSTGLTGVQPKDPHRIAAAGMAEPHVDALTEGLTAELVSRILADVEDISLMNITEAELLSFTHAELIAMATDAQEQSVEWVLPAPAAVAVSPRDPESGREARQVKFSAPLQAGASRRARAPAQRTPTPVPDSKASSSRQPLYAAAGGEPDVTDVMTALQPQRRASIRAGVRSARGGIEGNADRPGLALAADDTAPAVARAPHGLPDSRMGTVGSYAVPLHGERGQRSTITPRSTYDTSEARRPLSPHSAAVGTAGRGPRPTTPHKSRQPQDLRMPSAAMPPEASYGAAGGPAGPAAGSEGDTSQSPRQDKRSMVGQAPMQRRSAPSLQASVARGTATPRSSVRAAAVAAGLDPRSVANGLTQSQRRATQLSPGRTAPSHGGQAPHGSRVPHKSMSPSRGGVAARRVSSPRQSSELYHDLSPGPATRLAAESGYLVADERELREQMFSKRLLRSTDAQDTEASDAMQAPSRTLGMSARTFPKDVAAAVTRAQQARVQKAGFCPPAAAAAGSRGYTLHGIAVGDEVGGIVTHTSWAGAFVNIGAEVDGFVDPVTLPDRLEWNPGDLICGLRVELVDVEKPKLLLDGKRAWIMTLASG